MIDVLAYIFVVVILFFSTPLILWDIYKNNLVSSIKKSDVIGLSVSAFIPLLNHLVYLLYLIENDGKLDNFKNSKRKLNITYTCWNCNITSRYYQLKNDNSSCPHCGGSMRTSYTNSDNDDYPFAPRLTTMRFIKIQREKNKLNNIKMQLHSTERYDKELEAYEQLQMKKLQELETKANEIRAELAKKEGVNNENG